METLSYLIKRYKNPFRFLVNIKLYDGVRIRTCRCQGKCTVVSFSCDNWVDACDG
jgi:hypothetical protein